MSGSLRAATPSGIEADPGCGRRRAGLWVPLAALALLAAVLTFWAVSFLVHGSSGGGPWTPFPVFWPLFPLGFLLVVALLFVAWRWSWRGTWARGHPWGAGSIGPTAREVLRTRYARGEITADQFRRMARDLDEVG